MSKGFLTIAYNSETDNYLDCAEALAHSLRHSQNGPSSLSVMVPVGSEVPSHQRDVFENVIEFDPIVGHSGEWRAYLKCQAYEHTPYDETILVDADMLFPQDVSNWWGMMKPWPMLTSNHIYTFRGYPVLEKDNIYRKGFNLHHLPYVHTALMYFRKNKVSEDIFMLAKEMVGHWEEYVRYKYPNRPLENIPSDDGVFACSIKEGGYIEQVTSDHTDWFGFVHMKMKVQLLPEKCENNISDNFTDSINAFIQSDGSVVVENYLQYRPWHYYDKQFINNDILNVLRGDK